METTALVLAYVGVALMVGLAGVASSIGTAITGQAAVGAMKKNGGAFGSYMILSALPGSQGLYGFVCFFLVQKGLTDPTMVQGAAIFGAGLLVGLVNIASSIYQAKVCANGIAAIGNGHDVMGKTLILAAFPELYAILTVAAVFLIAMVGGADGPMVLFTSLNLSKEIFVPITVVAYLYLGLTYGGYPYLVRAMVPKRLRAIKMKPAKKPVKQYSAATKISFAVVMCVILCLLFPVAAPLFFSLFIGVVIKESGLKHVNDFISGPMLYGSTFFLGILLGVLCDAHTLLDPTVLKLLVLGILALLISGIGGILGGYLMYFFKRGNFNPVIGIAAVSCVPTTAKVAQKIVAHDNPSSMILPDALGANIMGVITSAIIAAIYVTVVPML